MATLEFFILLICSLGNFVTCKCNHLQNFCLGNQHSWNFTVLQKFQAWFRPSWIIGNLHCRYLGKFVLEWQSCNKVSWNHGTIVIRDDKKIELFTSTVSLRQFNGIYFSLGTINNSVDNQILIPILQAQNVGTLEKILCTQEIELSRLKIGTNSFYRL